jgi:hypothetical protein
LGLSGAAFFQRSQQPETTKIFRNVGQADNGPLVSQSTFSPENLGTAVGPAFQAAGIVVFYIGKLMAIVGNCQKNRTGPTNPGPPDFSMPNRIEQDGKPAEMGGVHRSHTAEGDLFLELPLVIRGSNERSVNRQNIKPRAILSAVIAEFNDVSLAKLVQSLGQLIVIAAFAVTHRV